LGFDAPDWKSVALALRHAIMPKQYNAELHVDWPTFGVPGQVFIDRGIAFQSTHLEQMGLQLGFTLHLRDRPSDVGVVERVFRTVNTEIVQTLGYKRPNATRSSNAEDAVTLWDLEKVLVEYVVNQYNQSSDACAMHQPRTQRWQAGLLNEPVVLDLDEFDAFLA
jgi:putative transposase